MSMTKTRYPAKLLLLGEYTVLKGSSALAIPLREYYGQWEERHGQSPIWLGEFIDYLIAHCSDLMDVDRLTDLATQWMFNLTIPIGYGLGSSGALVAGVYDYARTQKGQDLSVLMEEMGRMESFFHGKSSGFDPLVSYMDRGVIKTPLGSFQLWDSEDNPLIHKFELIDSGAARNQKKELIPAFLNLCEQVPDAVETLCHFNNMAIEALVNQQEKELVSALQSISAWQWQYMQAWIRHEIKDQWERSDGGIYKICGAGGGGFYLKYQA